jgi:hypothetical protein
LNSLEKSPLSKFLDYLIKNQRAVQRDSQLSGVAREFEREQVQRLHSELPQDISKD